MPADLFDFDAARLSEQIAGSLRGIVREDLRRKGVVVGMSGGVDSSVCAALSVMALGAKRVLGLLMPERESSNESLALARSLANHLGISTIEEDITALLDAAGSYRRRDEAVRSVLPEYDPGWRCKIVLPGMDEEDAFRIYSVVAESPSGEVRRARLPLPAYLQLVAATNFKQRCRKMIEYYHADRLNYAVVGTPNRLEYDQGFFVKLGDGAADVKPIAHLYKSQVYRLAEHLGLPREIVGRSPTTDTYSLPQSQEEFYFSLPYREMDVCLYAHNLGYTVKETANLAKLTEEQVERVFRDIDAKRKATRYLHLPPLLVEEVSEVSVRE